MFAKSVQLVPISQSLQYISALQHNGRCTEVYRSIQHDVTVAMGLLCGLYDRWSFKNPHNCSLVTFSLIFTTLVYNTNQVNEDTSMTKQFCRVVQGHIM